MTVGASHAHCVEAGSVWTVTSVVPLLPVTAANAQGTAIVMDMTAAQATTPAFFLRSIFFIFFLPFMKVSL